ncbi:MAG: aminotransferase class I/II-fold pyridoxal phosphate-dependent enzyme [Chitinivibrionales bacterium]|nr:aminotransferase class I/II-fold pyridoxal phosphate-dependent enzyme [Chitinivibrionales bacterium]
MQFIDLQSQQTRIRQSLDARIAAILAHGRYVLGPEVDELEAKLAARTGAAHCISCASGTDALVLGLRAMDIGPGDGIIVPAFTFVATAEAVILTGATPLFADIDPRTFNIDPDSIRRILDAPPPGVTIKGIIPVDLFGLPADYDRINAVADEHGLFVLEDAAQSFGAEYKGRKACALSMLAATSFYPAKPLGCYGDGGAVFTSDVALAAKLRSLRNHGAGTSQYDNVRVGTTSRLDSIQAAVLLSKLEIFDDELATRRELARVYGERLASTVTTPLVPAGHGSSWAQYSVLVDDRDAFVESLRGRGIPTMVYYRTPLHLQPAYAGLGYARGDFPVAEAVSERIVSLPMHPYLDESSVALVCDATEERQ